MAASGVGVEGVGSDICATAGPAFVGLFCAVLSTKIALNEHLRPIRRRKRLRNTTLIAHTLKIDLTYFLLPNDRRDFDQEIV